MILDIIQKVLTKATNTLPKNNTSPTFFYIKSFQNCSFCFRLQAIRFINCIKQICTFVGSKLTFFLQAMSTSPRLSSQGRLTWQMLFSEFDLRSLRSSPTSVPKSMDYNLQRDAHRDTPSKAWCNLLWQHHYLGRQYFSTSQRRRGG